MGVLVGSSAIKDLWALPELRESAHVFLFRGRSSFARSGAKAGFYDGLPSHVFVTEEIVPGANPSWEHVKQAAQRLCLAQCDAIVAIGGGSVLDTAKAAIVASQRPLMNLDALCVDQLEHVGPRPPVIAVPTTPGTGAECTPFATVYQGLVKHSVNCREVVPDTVILDPTFLRSLSRYQTVCSVLDSACQSIESLWARKRSRNSAALACHSLDKLKPVIAELRGSRDRAIQQQQLLSDMALGGYFSGRAIALSTTTAPHALSYRLTSEYGIPHGHAVAVMMRNVLEYHERVGVDLAEVEMEVATRLFDNSCESLARTWGNLLEDLCIAPTLASMGVSDSAFEALVRGTDATRLRNHPVELNASLLLRILR